MSARSGTGKLRSMRVSDPSTRSGSVRAKSSTDGFKALVLDNLSGLDEVMPRPMFGGLGLYCRGVFFGIVARDVLYLKADDELREEFVRVGATAFKPFVDRPVSMKYFSVPTAILESPDELLAWARRSVTIAARTERA